jgi:hypothetical protein
MRTPLASGESNANAKSAMRTAFVPESVRLAPTPPATLASSGIHADSFRSSLRLSASPSRLNQRSRRISSAVLSPCGSRRGVMFFTASTRSCDSSMLPSGSTPSSKPNIQ